MKQHRNVTARQEALSERSLFAAVLTLKSVDECRAFFRDLCTPAELQAMADRWAVVDWLQKGVPYREIHRLTSGQAEDFLCIYKDKLKRSSFSVSRGSSRRENRSTL
jgi:TrpR-related protein YerC/YecD